eukprot:2755767-Lingulodinium_polyedra.AAC.1
MPPHPLVPLVAPLLPRKAAPGTPSPMAEIAIAPAMAANPSIALPTARRSRLAAALRHRPAPFVLRTHGSRRQNSHRVEQRQP